MMRLISGGSASGKSAYAEKLACELYEAADEPKRLIYLATMRADCDEARARIERHRKQRAGKGFETVEYVKETGSAVSAEGERYFSAVIGQLGNDRVVLLEDLSNMLTVNMFCADGSVNDDADDIIMEQISLLNKNCRELIIVTNDIFSDGTDYDEITEEYRKKLAKLNIKIAAMAGGVTEVVAGIPIEHGKGSGEIK